MHEKSTQIHCPQCGYTLPLHFRFSKLVRCPACRSSIFLEDEGARVAGERSVLADLPSLLQLHQPLRYQNELYTPIGHIRYVTERYSWDEWWVYDQHGKPYWISVDDGDYLIEEEIPFRLSVYSIDALRLGGSIEGWQVTEIGEGLCQGFEGELPQIVTIGERHHYAHLSKPGGEMMTLSFEHNTKKLYRGRWIDPYELYKAQ